MVRVSRVLIVHQLCVAIGMLLAWNAYWVIRYWSAVESLYWEAVRWLRLIG